MAVDVMPKYRSGGHWTEADGPFTTLILIGTLPPDDNGRREDDILVGAYDKNTVRDVLAAIESDALLGLWLDNSLGLVLNRASQRARWIVDETVEAIATMAPPF